MGKKLSATQVDSKLPVNSFRYESASGFLVETTRGFQPILSSEGDSIIWWQLSQCPSDAYFLSQLEIGQWQSLTLSAIVDSGQINTAESQSIESCQLSYGLDPNLEVLRNLSPDRLLTLNCTGLAVLRYLDDLTVYSMPSTTVTTQVLHTKRFFNQPTRKVLSHTGTLAGRPFLVPRSREEAIEVVVREDQLHFEAIALSRDRRHPDLGSGDSGTHNVCERGASSWLLVNPSGEYCRTSQSVQSVRPCCSSFLDPTTTT